MPLFTATGTFGPADSGWEGYLEWAGLPHLTRLVSLDGLLCRSLLDFGDEDWPFLAAEGRHGLSLLTSLPYLLSRVAGHAERNLLQVFKNPEVDSFRPEPSFSFVGYDLIERTGSVSALCNCGGFPDCFAGAELTTLGLLPDLRRAREVQLALRQLHPDEAHADCDVWAICLAE